MNNHRTTKNDHKVLLLLEEFSKGLPLTQRDLSRKLGIALGLINSYIKNLIAKGYLRVSNIPKNSYNYLLTPKGMAEKTRLTYHLLQDYNRIFKEARRDFRQLFHALYEDGIRNVAFAGVDDVAEIAYLSLQEVDIEFVGAMDDDRAGKNFFKTVIIPFSDSEKLDFDYIIITSYHRKNEIYKRLIDSGVSDGTIKSIYPISYNTKNRGRFS